jgi:type II secretion system protein C
MYMRKVLLIGKLALALMLGYVVVRTLLPEHREKISAPASALGGSAAHENETTGSPDLSFEDYAKIVERNPFGTSGKWPSTTNFTGSRHSVSEELGLALSGTISGSPTLARAVIKDLKTGVIDLYEIDQTVADARIESIEEDAVVLVHNGQRKVLKLNRGQSGSNNISQVASSQTTKEINNMVRADLSAKKADTNVRTKTSFVEAILNNAAIEPYSVDGRIEGLRITDLENISAVKKLGLKNSDVIRAVNGHRLTNKQKAYQIFKKARSQPAIDIELLRDNKIKKLSFAM